MSDRIYRIAELTLELPHAVATKVLLPNGSKQHLLQLEDIAASWRWGTDQTKVQAGGGIRMDAGQHLTIDGPLIGAEIFIKQNSGVSVDLNWAYLYPKNR